MTSLLGILICAALFGLFAVVRPVGCTGHCTGCTGSCGRHEGKGDHHVG